jgi:hypothetical protein
LKSEKEYLATVHKYDLNDLFLTYIPSGGNEVSGNKRIKLPELGKWIMEKAPDGRLFQNQEKH